MEELQRPGSSRSVRPGKFTQTFSRFKGIIRIPGRKPTSHAQKSPTHHENRGRPGLANAMHPYPKATPPTLRESMSLKPYMSQPMLALQRTSMDTDPHSQPSDPDSEASSSSPDPSPCRMHSEFPLPTKKQNDDTRRRSRRMSTHSLTSPPTEEFGTRPETTYYDTISGPWDSISTSIKDVHDNEPTPPTPPPKPVRKNLQNAQNPPRRAPLPAPPPLGSSSPPRTTTSPGPRPLPPRRPLPPVPQEPPTTALTTSTDTTNTHLEARSSIHLPTAVTSPAVPTRNSLSESLAATPKPEPMPVRFASEADGEALDIILNSDSSARRPAPPKLNLPTSLSRRISLLQAAGGVRLSPTIMARPPPLPIMNLPRLPVPASGDVLGEGAGVSRRRSERVGLGSMPALPLQGTTREAGGHEEMDDMEEDDEEEEEETDGMETDEESEPRTSFTSTDSGSARSDEGILSRGSYDVPRPELPPLALASPFDIRFQHSGEASSSSSWSSGMIAGDGSVDKKGKSKLVVPSPLSSGSSAITASSDESSALSSSSSSDMGGEFSRILRPSLSVTTSTNSSYYSFASGGEDAGEYFDGRLAKAISQSRSDATDRTPLAAARADPFNKTNPSPLATPRALSQFEMPKAIAVLQGANDGKSSNRDSLAFVGGGGGGINSRPASVLVQRPTMYKRASRSLVDLQAAAKRQEVEQIVREEEEEQEREQRRRRSMRRSVVVGSSNGGDDSLEGYRASMHLHHLRNEGLGPMAEEETLPNRDALGITKASIAPKEASYSQDGPRIGVHGGEDPNYAGTGGSSVAGSSSVVSGAAGSNVMNPSTTTTWKDATGAPGVLEGRQHQKNNRISMAPAYEASLNPLPPLRRRRSMPTYNESTPPPPYPSFAPHPYGLHASLKILPREDEGREVLPGYSNAIFLKAIMPLKMEFSAPGVQAKDRKWKRVLVVLEGTMLKVYRAPTGPGGVSAIEQWWENKVGAGDVALGPPPAIPAAGSAGTGRAAIAVPAKKEERNREEEKVNQQYLQATVHDELRVDEGQGLSQAAASTASLAGSVAAQRHGKEHRQHHHHHHQPQATQVAITKSALNLAVHLLKPGSRHIRRNSDTGPPSPTAAFRAPDGIPRSSLNLPRPGTSTPTSSTFSSSSRSHSPMPSSSSSVTPHGSRSHSPMPSGSSSRLTVPSSSSSFSSRPPTPTSAGSSRSSRLRTTNTGSRTAYGRACKSEDFEPPKQDLIRCYTMQNAESGLGNDYLKRKNVIRVRLEGEQFLLQAKDVSSVVQWIEGLQAATNIALDLDDRPMPRGPIFPRRRRRRRPNVTPILVNGQAPLATSAVMETYTPTSATAGQPVFRRT